MRTICAPVASSPESSSLAKAGTEAWSSATPPPGTTPSSTAALALRTASSMRCLRSLSSTSVAAPALITRAAPGLLAQPLLQLLAVVVGVGVVDLGADLVDPARDLVRVTGAVDERGLVLCHDAPVRPAAP